MSTTGKLILVGVALTLNALTYESTKAHDVYECQTIYGVAHICGLIWDPFNLYWVYECAYYVVPVGLKCSSIKHYHHTETAQERDERVLLEKASCLHGAVDQAVAACYFTEPGVPFPILGSELCMKDYYPETYRHIGVLTRNQTTQGTGEMTEDGPLYANGVPSWGIHEGSSTVNRIKIDVGRMVNESDREDLLADTIVHEKIHWEDWEDNNNHDILHSDVETRAGKIVEELSTYLSSCSIDWTQQRSIVYEP